MFIGPVFTREVTIAPRREKTFIARAVYGGLLLLLISTVWLVMTGTQIITDTGDFARFGAALFSLLAPLQLVIMLFFSSLLAASGVAQEKDRRTLLLLLLTNLSNRELVLGKLMACLLEVLVFLVVSVPLLMLTSLLGGVSWQQIVRVTLVTFFAIMTCGSLGSCVALKREKTFQAISTTVLILVLWLGFWQVIGYGLLGRDWLGIPVTTIADAASPWRALFVASQPTLESSSFSLLSLIGPIQNYLAAFILLSFLINGFAILMVRLWNPSREVRKTTALEEDTWRKEAVEARLAREAQERLSAQKGQAIASNPYERLEDNLFAQVAEHPDLAHHEESQEEQTGTTELAPDGRYKMDAAISAAPGKVRHVWDNPIIWREICTQAYGRRAWVVRIVYLLLTAAAFVALHMLFQETAAPTLRQIAAPFVPLLLLSLLLVNAQAVTSLTSERDGGTFNLLLVSDISPKEFVYGKLGGTFYNMKEMVLFPVLLSLYVAWLGAMTPMTTIFLIVGLLVLYFFVAMVGIHIGMQYDNTRSAVATSLGIIFFLFVGIATCMWIMVAFSGSFEAQLQPFLAFMIGGGVGLYVSLGARNPSSAIALASFICPLATFYAITSLLLGQSHWVFFSLAGAYLFTSIAMLIPAIDEFDVATGRTTAD